MVHRILKARLLSFSLSPDIPSLFYLYEYPQKEHKMHIDQVSKTIIEMDISDYKSREITLTVTDDQSTLPSVTIEIA